VLAYIAGIPLAIGAFAAGMVCALATGYLKDNSRIKQDTVMGVVFSGMFGLGPRALHVADPAPTCISTTSCSATCSGSAGAMCWRPGSSRRVTALALAQGRDLLLHAFDPQQAGPSACRSGCCITGC
jgi:manganese/iron transport system permease protein